MKITERNKIKLIEMKLNPIHKEHIFICMTRVEWNGRKRCGENSTKEIACLILNSMHCVDSSIDRLYFDSIDICM